MSSGLDADQERLLREIRDSTGQEIYQDLFCINSSIQALVLNYEELIKVSERLDEGKYSEDSDPDELDVFCIRFATRLHNYITATYSAFRQMKSLENRHFEHIPTPNLDEQVAETFGKRAEFIKRLRVYIQHYTMPRIRTKYNPGIEHRVRGSQPDVAIYIHKRRLLDWDSWNSAREYVEMLGDEVDIMNEIHRYHVQFKRHNSDVIERLRESYKGEIKERNELVAELKRSTGS